MSKQSRLRRAHKKKRAKRIPTFGRNSGHLLRRMSRDHIDVLQNIEEVLVSCWRERPVIDDHVVSASLSAAMRDEVPEDDRRDIAGGLADMRHWRQDVSDRVWQDCLLTVYQSVHRHSTCHPGERSYLRFVSPFVP